MPRVKQMVKRALVETTKAPRRCKFAKEAIPKGTVCLVVYEGPARPILLFRTRCPGDARRGPRQTRRDRGCITAGRLIGGAARFDEVELRLGAVDEHDPVLDVFGVVALGFQRCLGDHLPGLAFQARPDPLGLRAGPHEGGLAPGCRGIRLYRNCSALRTNGAVV